MKKNNSNSIKLGVFVSLGLLLLISCIYYIGKKKEVFGTSFRISGIFKDISGLQIGNNVRLLGINVGVIDDITVLNDTSVKVDFAINEADRRFIKTDARATIGSDGLMGNKIVVIMPGTVTAKQIGDDKVIATSVPVNVDDIMRKLQQTSDNLSSITGNLSVIMGNIRSGKGTIGKLFMDTVFAKNIDQTIVNIKQGAGGFKQNMDAASHNILLRGFIKRKEKKAEEAKEQKKADEQTKQ